MSARRFDGPTFKKAREAAGVGKAEVAAAMGVREAAVASWEAGRSAPDPEKLAKLAELVRAPLKVLFPREIESALGGPTLADLRQDAGYTQRDTAKITRTKSEGPVKAAELGRTPLKEQYVPLLADAYKVTVEEVRAAEQRSFGRYVPPVHEEPRSSPAPVHFPVLRTLQDRITYLLANTFTGESPTDEQIAQVGNAGVGQGVLTGDLVRDLRTGAQTEASPAVLDALTVALSAPPAFLTGNEAAVSRIIEGVRLVKSGLRMAARGGAEDGLSTELLRYLNDLVEGIDNDLRPEEAPERG